MLKREIIEVGRSFVKPPVEESSIQLRQQLRQTEDLLEYCLAYISFYVSNIHKIRNES
jgi:hypothetical protein